MESDDTHSSESSPNRVVSLLMRVKIPRYAHMAKYHQLRGELGEAEYYYNQLAAAESETSGDTERFAAVLYELARLNHYHEVQHTPDVQMIYNSIGRATQIHIFYQNALQIRGATLGENHAAYAQSLYGLATMYRDIPNKAEEATALLRQALTVQINRDDTLPAALSLSALGYVLHLRRQPVEAMACYKESLDLLPYPSSANLLMLAEAADLCKVTPAGSEAEPGRSTVQDPVQKALKIQSTLADPYFTMAFELLADGGASLLSDMLELHRQQYIGEYRDARIAALRKLAGIYREVGQPASAAPLLEEAAKLQLESA